MIIAIWVVTLLLLGLWTLMAWGAAELLSTDGAWVASIEPWLAKLPFGGWLESWFPSWLQAAQALLDFSQTTLAWLGGAAPVLVWGLWFAGALVLALLAGVMTVVIALVRRNMPAPPAPPVAPA